MVALVLNLKFVSSSPKLGEVLSNGIYIKDPFCEEPRSQDKFLGPQSNRRSNSPSSGPCKVILFHPVVISSMRQEKEKCFQDPKERNPKPAATKATGRDKHVFSKKGQTLP